MKMNKYLYIYVVSFYLYILRSQALLSCKNEDNKDVDWFIILKLPASYNFFYLSSDSNNAKWMTPKFTLEDNKNLLALTLAQIYVSEKNSAFFALYNNEKSKERWSSEGSRGSHLKGAINFDGKTGYWLVHSVPKFPNIDKYNYTRMESKNGQSFLCVSLRFSNLKIIATQLMMMYSDVYGYNLPKNYTTDSDLLQKLYKLVLNEHSLSKKSERIELSTLNNVKLSHFGKSKMYFKDLYDGLISMGLNSSLYVETWREGRGIKLNSTCNSKNKVFNIRKVSLNGIEYFDKVDHSKWAFSELQGPAAVCIGDMDRMVDQIYAGGGSLCIFDISIWKAFHDNVKDFEPCPKSNF